MERTVSRRLDRLGKLRDGDLEAALDELEDLLVPLVGDERDRETLGSETTGTTAREGPRGVSQLKTKWERGGREGKG